MNGGAAPHKTRGRARVSAIGSVGFTAALLGAIALALGGTSPAIAMSTIPAISLLVGLFHFAFAGSGFFSVVFANAVGVYSCLYVVFVLSNFPEAQAVSVQAGFLMPLASFAAGALMHRKAIQHILDADKYHHASDLHDGLRWVVPLALVAAVTTYLHAANWSADSQDSTLLVAMSVISGVVWFTSKNIVLFLIECGEIFRSFVTNALSLSRPAFALLTCYSILTIFFGCLYTIYDQSSSTPHFLYNGEIRRLTFVDGLYLSLSTLTTVGFGDFVGASPLARLLLAVEVLCGVLLLLFGVDAMLDRSRGRDSD